MEKKTVLIVEDENLISLRIKLVLEQNSYEVIDVVDSAEKALKVLENSKPDIILLDILLSGEMDGITASSIIKEKHDIPVIFLTAIKDSEQLERLARCAHYGVIYKPIEDSEITAAIEKVLSCGKKEHSGNSEDLTTENPEIFVENILNEKSLDLINSITLFLDSNGYLLKINSRAEEVFKIKSDEIAGKKLDFIFDIKSVKNWKQPAKILKELLDNGDIEMFSTFVELNFNDIVLGVSKMSSAVKDPGGKISFFIIILEDKHFEEIMDNFYRISSERIKAIINNIGEGIGVVNGDEVFVFSNPTADRIFGVYPQSLIGKNLKSFLARDNYQFVLSETEKRKLLKKTTYFIEISRPDGEKRILSVTATPETDKNGNFVSSIGIFTDITEKIKQEKTLKEEQEKLKHLINGSRDILYSTDIDGNIVFIGPQTKTYNLAPDDVVGRNILEFIHPDDRERAMREYEQVMMTGKSFPSEVRLLDREGAVHWFEDYGNPVFDGKGNVKGQVGMLRDITERKRIENELTGAVKEKEILLHEIHHRVRNNLEVISSLLQLQASTVGDEKLAVLLKETQSRVLSIGHVHGLLYHSQNYSTIEFSNFIDILTEENSLTFRKMVNQLEIIKDLKKLSISIDKAIPAGLIVNEIMMNCMRHAFVGMDKGTLWISLDSRTEYMEEGKTVDFAEVKIKDNGLGIPDETDINRAKTLGMTIIKLLTKQLNGEILLKKENGTEIRLKFPL